MSTSNSNNQDASPEESMPSIADWRYLPPVLDAAGCARLLGMKSDREVLRLARERKLPSVPFGKRVLFLTDTVIETLRKRQIPAVEDRAFVRRGRVDMVAEGEE